MRKISIWMIGCFLMATIICIFGQGLAYFLSENIAPIAPVYYLTGLTILGVLLYVVTGVLLYFFFKKQTITSENQGICLMILGIVAPSSSAWAFFVTVMWWG
ncbi:hypothetical protein FQV26_07815 [Planococcus sp. CPCC 101016]|uniref:hypothetical protein n=1 Tax=Planococcus sp. CPCC 101016 TaxID=2599617 RepID=UPI0011B5E4C1|nr:hypothetical protein [Planococcus sp. CPCC 101016]TWT07706.1 hypothetical protein FQV26_07815 [Planococcus sp. CPCC 101016]